MWKSKLVDRAFFLKNSQIVAKNLLGKYLVRIIEDKKVICKIVETEAYDGPLDDANHAFNNRRSKRNEVMFWNGGYAHIFMIYGMYYCLNIVCDKEDYPSAVLIRACEVLTDERVEAPILNHKLTNGPGKLCRYLNIDRSFDGYDIVNGTNLYLVDNNEEVSEVVMTPRVNVDYAINYKDKLFRYYLKESKSVSKK